MEAGGPTGGHEQNTSRGVTGGILRPWRQVSLPGLRSVVQSP